MRGGSLGGSTAPHQINHRRERQKEINKITMTRQTTAAFIMSPKTIGPWGDRAWRIRDVYELVEGGSTSYLLLNGHSGTESVLTTDSLSIHYPSPDALFEALIALLSLNAGSQRCIGLLAESHNLVDGALAPCWDLADDVLASLSKELSSLFRIGVILLDDFSMADADFVEIVRSHNFDVDTFAPTS
jgi:hypothetical protein